MRPTCSIVAVCMYIRMTKLLSRRDVSIFFFVVWFQNFDALDPSANTTIEKSVFLILFQNLGSGPDHPRSSIIVSRG